MLSDSIVLLMKCGAVQHSKEIIMSKFIVVENGPDSFDYVVGVFNDDKSRFYNQWGMTGEQKAIEFARSMTDRYAYLGYGYEVVKA